MLTKKDLESIGTVVDTRIDRRFEEFGSQVDQTLNKRFEEFGSQVDQTLNKRFEEFGSQVDQTLNKRFEEFGIEMDNKLDAKLKPIKSDLGKIKKDLKTTIEFFDHDITSLKKRTKRIENHLGLPPVSVA